MKKTILMGLVSITCFSSLAFAITCPPVSALKNTGSSIIGYNSNGTLYTYIGYFNYHNVNPATARAPYSCIYHEKTTGLGYNLTKSGPPPR